MLLLDNVPADLGIVVVIPCFNESLLLNTLDALLNCTRSDCSTEIIVVLNASENADEKIIFQNNETKKYFLEWKKKHLDYKLKFYLIEACLLPKKYAGVGLARKIGMDEAYLRFEKSTQKNKIIACMDADSLCEKNYFTALENHFLKNPKTPACSIYFEHPVNGNEFSKEVYEGIIQYELFLRYYNQGLRYAGFPFAFHTIGSSMAVRAEVYKKQGGMNKRKAGEDFYFLQKIMLLGFFSELNETKIIPSPRPSNRVPFGTGKAIQKWLDEKNNSYSAYHPQSFIDIKKLFDTIESCYQKNNFSDFLLVLPNTVQLFLAENNFSERVKEWNENSTSKKYFLKRFFSWFDGFTMLKFMHYVRDEHYGLMDLQTTVSQLLELRNKGFEKNNFSAEAQLKLLREIERSENYFSNLDKM
ncbi:MAG: glycosyltransferase [Bacteroidia bacterium]